MLVGEEGGGSGVVVTLARLRDCWNIWFRYDCGTCVGKSWLRARWKRADAAESGCVSGRSTSAEPPHLREREHEDERGRAEIEGEREGKPPLISLSKSLEPPHAGLLVPVIKSKCPLTGCHSNCDLPNTCDYLRF